MSDQKKKVIADDDWKQQAKKEKQQLKDDADKKTKQQPDMGPANFMTLVNSLAIQAMYYMGQLPQGPDEKEKPAVNLEIAKHHIDLLGILEDKTKGNLSDDEDKALASALNDLRMMYVQMASQ